MDQLDTFLREQLQNDAKNLKTNPAVFQRLHYLALLKNTTNTERQNSVIPGLAFLFTSKFISLKLSAVILLFVFFGYQHFNQNTNPIHANDTAQYIYNQDTINFKTFTDTLGNE